MTDYTITRDDGAADVFALQDALNVLKASAFWDSPTAKRLLDLRRSIEEQVKPAVEEPEGFGSIVRAVCLGGSEHQLWQRSYGDSKHYWESETGVVDVWSDLTDVEVLRVGIGDARGDVLPESTEDYRAGVEDFRAKMLDTLQLKRSEALTAERQNAYDVMTGLITRLLP